MKRLNVLLLLFAVVVAGCKNNESNDKDATGIFTDQLQSAQTKGISEDYDFPEWLLVKINEIETAHAKDVSIVKVRIFRGEWRKQIVYYITDPFKSCGFCDVYYEGGTQVKWSPEDITTDNFCTESKNWKLIYEFGNADYY